MKKNRLFLVAFAAVPAVLVSQHWPRRAPAGAPAPESETGLSFRVVFGEKQTRARDWSGSVELSAGRVLRVTPWRFFADDAVEGAGWKLRLKRGGLKDQPDQPSPLFLPNAGPVVVPAGIIVTVDAPETASIRLRTAQGDIGFRLRELPYGRVLEFHDGDVVVQRTPSARQVSGLPSGERREENDYPSLAITRAGVAWVAWQAYQECGDHVYARHATGAGWSEAFRLTERQEDVFQTAVAEDAAGRVWVAWSQRSGEDWDLFARTFDGARWSATRRLTAGDRPNLFHLLVAGPPGALHLVWIGYRDGQSRVLWSRLDGDTWSRPTEIGEPGAWAPDAAVDSQGNLIVVWDSYRAGNYDVFLARIRRDGTVEPARQITRSVRFQAHPAVTVDKQDRIWVAWDESGFNWGKGWSLEDQWRATTLYRDRRTRVAVLDNGVWKQPAGDPMAAAPRRYHRYVHSPRLACDAAGRVWMALQVPTSASVFAQYWANNPRWEFFLTSYEGDRWTPLTPVPQTSSRLEGPLQMKAGPEGIRLAWMNDNRSFGFPPAPARFPQAIMTARFAGGAPPTTPALEPFEETAETAPVVHAGETADVARLRAYRKSWNGAPYRILRGDFHRHTEISADGVGDGSVEDYFRYMLDAAQMDTGIIADHNAGADNEYSWWRTEKAIDLFHIQGRFTPLFGYERSVRYPNGHRNVVFPERGVRTLPIGPEERDGKVNTGPLLYPYLRQHRGISMPHSMATDQGTDYRDNDPELEPLVEIYQGFHASYEYEGAPRAETGDFHVAMHGQFRPQGFYWNALAKGYRLGVQSSSDHLSTHTSYTMIYTPSLRRADIVDGMRRRHVYGATDNILLDYEAVDAAGGVHLMGDTFESERPPRLKVRVAGTSRIDRVEIIRNARFVHTVRPAGNTAEFTYVDNESAGGESYYYVRVIQEDRNLAWSSPIWVRRK